MKKFITKWLDAHNFFFANSKRYVLVTDSTWKEKLGYYLRFWVAYAQFMWYSRDD
jgi:hypothetical protein